MLPEELKSETLNLSNKLSAEGELRYSDRVSLYTLMRRLSELEHENAFYYRYSKLGLLCARHTLSRSDDGGLVGRSETILDNSLRVLHGSYEISSLKDECSELRKAIDEAIDDDGSYSLWYSLLSCVAAAETVVYDVNFFETTSTELDIDPDDWEAAFFSSISASGGAVWEKGVDNGKRKDFWLWFLFQAIEQAWAIP